MVCSGIIIIIIIPLMAIGQLCAGHYWCKTPSYLLTGHYCHFSLLCSVNRKKKKRQKKKKEKSLGIYSTWRCQGWGIELHLGGVRSSPWLCGGRRCCFCSLCGSMQSEWAAHPTPDTELLRKGHTVTSGLKSCPEYPLPKQPAQKTPPLNQQRNVPSGPGFVHRRKRRPWNNFNRF